MNVAAFVPARKLPKVAFPDPLRLMAVSFEIASYVPNSLRAIDDEVDAYSRRPGTQRLEKITGDIYLEQILARARRVHGDDPTSLTGEIKDRSLKALAVALNATARFVDLETLSVAVGGRRVWGPVPGDPNFNAATYSWKFAPIALQAEVDRVDRTARLAPSPPRRITLISADEDSFLRGSATAACEWAF